MFRAVLQKNEKVFRGLFGSLLHLSQEETVSVEIMDPIIIGETLSDKEFRLDINIRLNTNKKVNLEMQIVNFSNWENRSLSYLCRAFDQLSKGQEYNEVKTAIHIGILDITLFKDPPEFNVQYQMMNTKTHKIYCNNFLLNALDLKQIELATEEDKRNNIDYWVRLIRATTWEEIKKMTLQNEYLKEATNTLLELTADDIARKRCRDREDYYADMRWAKCKIKEQEEKIKEQAAKIKEQAAKIKEQEAKIKEQEAKIKEQEAKIKEQEAMIKEQASKIEKVCEEIALLEYGK